MCSIQNQKCNYLATGDYVCKNSNSQENKPVIVEHYGTRGQPTNKILCQSDPIFNQLHPLTCSKYDVKPKKK
jgi:hypothetical protein